MDVWYHNEITYPFVPQDVLDRAESVRIGRKLMWFLNTSLKSAPQ